MSCGNKGGNCSNCQGCNNVFKPKNCPSNGCGRCCRLNKETETEFINELLEVNYLPCLFFTYENIVHCIYKLEKNTSLVKIKAINEIITKLNNLDYVSLDIDVELDEYSYHDYSNFNVNDYLGIEDNINIIKGSLSITDVFYNNLVNNNL